MSTRTDIQKLQIDIKNMDDYLSEQRKLIDELKTDHNILDKQINGTYDFSSFGFTPPSLKNQVRSLNNKIDRIDETLDLVLAHLGVKRVEIAEHAELHEVTDDELEDLHGPV